MVRKGSLTAATVTSPVDSRAALITSLPIRPNPLIPSTVLMLEKYLSSFDGSDLMQEQNINLCSFPFYKRSFRFVFSNDGEGLTREFKRCSLQKICGLSILMVSS